MNSYARTALQLAASVSAMALTAGTAMAQDAPAARSQAAQPTTATDEPVSQLGDIIVTARRRAERMQDVPIAVSAIAGEDLTRQSVLQTTDLSRKIPGLTVADGGFGGAVPRYNIRSQVQFEQLLTLDPSVGVYFADVVQARAHGTNAAFFDLASVEVLKGPQGTLFGRNTTGGAIVFTPRGATQTLGGYINAQIGNYNTRTFDGALNIPLSDTLSVRLAGRVADRDGYTFSPAANVAFDDENNESWRATVQWNPTEALSNTLVVNGYHADEHGTGFRLVSILPGSTFETRAPQLIPYLASLGDSRVAGNQDPNAGTTVKTRGVSNTTTWNSGTLTFKNIFGYREVDNVNASMDFDGSPFFIYQAPEQLHEKQYSDEFQVLGTALNEKLNWIAGAYWFKETGNETQRSTITVIPQDITRTGFVENVSKSIFAQGTYDLGFVEGLSLTAGVRYTWDDRELQQIGRNLLNNACLSTVATQPTCLSPVFQKDFGAPTYTIGLDWKFAPNRLAYVVHRRGYRAGGFNLRANTPGQFVPFDPEYVNDVEIGLKADWEIAGTQLRTNLAAYYQWYTDIQRSVTFVDPANSILTVSVINAANAHVSGFEGEVRWLPTPNLEISANVAHSALRYDEFNQAVAGGGVQDLSGNRIGFSPEWKGGASVRYTQPLGGNAGSLVFQGDIYRQSHMELADINVPGGVIDPYTVTNFRVEWNELLGSRVSAAAYLRNAADKDYFNGGFAITGLGPISKTYAPPRTYGIELRVPFGG
jgi:iron complex outermembrane receptor protein